MDATKWKRQSSFDDKEIKERLEGFEKLVKNEDVDKVLKVGMHIRYISYDERHGRRTLKMGGVLQFIDPQLRYLRLQSMINNRIKPWSVQLAKSEIHYKRMIRKDDRYESIVEKFESDDLLQKYIDMVDGSNAKMISNIVKYCERHSDGKLSVLLKQHQTMRRSREKRESDNTTEVADDR